MVCPVLTKSVHTVTPPSPYVVEIGVNKDWCEGQVSFCSLNIFEIINKTRYRKIYDAKCWQISPFMTISVAHPANILKSPFFPPPKKKTKQKNKKKTNITNKQFWTNWHNGLQNLCQLQHSLLPKLVKNWVTLMALYNQI